MRLLFRSLSLLLTLSFTLGNNASAANDNKMALDYMKTHNLRQAEEEYSEGVYHFGWKLMDKISYGNGALLIMRVMDLMYAKDDETQATGLEVLALNQEGKIIPFENFVKIPSELLIQHQVPRGYFFKLRNRQEIIKALKMQLSGRSELKNAFTGWAVSGGKASYDKTPGRNWRLLKVTFSLQGHDRDEVHDIQAADLDSDFDAFYAGGHQVEIEIDGQKRNTLVVGPWGGKLLILNSN